MSEMNTRTQLRDSKGQKCILRQPDPALEIDRNYEFILFPLAGAGSEDWGWWRTTDRVIYFV